MKSSAKEEIPQQKKINVFKILKKTWNIIEKVLMILILFVSLIIITQRVSNNEKAFLGFRLFRVLTGSMEPKYHVGDVILVKEEELDKIKIGDDITYTGSSGTMKGQMVTHQVIDIEILEGQKVFHTQGIANNKEDPIVYGGQINGVVQGKSYILTTITSALTNQYILYFFVIIPITIVIFFAFTKGNTKYED